MFLKVIGIAAIAVSALLGTGAQAAPGTIISAVAATVDTNGPGFGSIANTYNQAGLTSGYTSGVTNFDTYIAGDPQHTDIFACCEFFGNSGTNSLRVTYDLGSVTKIDRLALWNEESSGIGLLNLLASTDGVTFTSLLSGLTPTDNPVGSYLADVFSFAAISTRYVRFEASGCPQSNPGTFAACAIGEVAFRAGAVPEPSSWMMLIAGFGLTGAAMRRRAIVAA